MDVDLLQREVAEQIGCSKVALLMWEKDRSSPEIRFWPAIICFLGYDPTPKPQSIAELLLTARRLRGWSQKRLAQFRGVDPTSVSRWELGLGRPEQYLGTKLLELGELIRSYRQTARPGAGSGTGVQQSSGG